ncbi:hypothetical protein JXB02_03145 [Candidatus Woesearchaeota archaeon]|nr:hypothetical protein [Candidatus Woesearchaeota archaeon]
MRDYLDEANEELKRADHLIYVSLKYTRTVDVFKSIIMRLINCFNFIIDGLLEMLLRQKRIAEVPAAYIPKVELLKKTFPDDAYLIENLDRYLLFRKLDKAEYTKANEFRRHVTMSAAVAPSTIIDVTIDSVTEHFKQTTELLHYINETFGGEDA